MTKKKIPAVSQRIKKQIARYGRPWSDLSPRRQWYERHKVRSRGRPVNAYIPYPREPSCYGNWEDDACGVCGQKYENFKAGVVWEDGVELMKEYARRENVQGGGYRSRGAVLYAMAVLKRQAWYMRHELGCCMPVYEMSNYMMPPEDFNFFPFPKIVWYLTEYGLADKKSKDNVELAWEIRDYIQDQLNQGATTLRELQIGDFNDRIRVLEKKYRYKSWWSAMTREYNGVFFKQKPPDEPGGFIDDLEDWLPSQDETGYDSGEFPF